MAAIYEGDDMTDLGALIEEDGLAYDDHLIEREQGRRRRTLRDLQDEAFEALAPYFTPGGAYDEDLWKGEANLCAAHDASGCPLCGWVM